MNTFLYLALVSLVALLSSRLMQKIKLPNVTGYLITGIIMGPCVFGLLFNGFNFLESFQEGSQVYNFVNNLKWVSTIALGFIAFTIGNNFQLNQIKTLGKKFILITIFEAVGACIFVFFGLSIAHFIEVAIKGRDYATITWPLVLTLSAISCATAPAATLLVIRQYKANGPLVKTLLPVVALDDAEALIMFSILFGVAKTIQTGNELNLAFIILKPLIEIIISIIIGTLLGLLISYLGRFFKSRANKSILCIFAILTNIGFYYLFMNTNIPYFGNFELSYLLMCMMSSAVFVNISPNSYKTMERIDEITPYIFVLFFVLSGTNLDLTIFASSKVIALIIIALTYLSFRVLGKYLGSRISTKLTNEPKSVQKYLGLALIPQAGVAIGLSTSAANSLGKQSSLGAIIVACILISTIIYELIGPVITKVALEKAGEIPKQ